MLSPPDQIDRWRQAPTETQILEFKQGKNHYDSHKLSEYCVAIANEGGGHFLIGIVDAPPRPVVGTSAFPNLVATADSLFIKLGFRVDVEEVQHPDGRVLVFHIPSRPRGSAYHLDGRYLMRSGEALKPMSEDRLRVIFAEGQLDWVEATSLFGLSESEVVDLLDTQTFFELIEQPYPTTQSDVLRRLREFGFIDRSATSWSIRRIGGLLVAKDLNQFPELARKAPRVVVYAGETKLTTRLDANIVRGYAVGFQALTELVMSHLPQNEVIENALRRQVKLLPEQPVRELLANALIHQDVTISGASPMIEIYSDRVEFSNPGEPIVPVERFIDGWLSRSERLTSLMRKMRICEEKSSGIDRVVAAAELFQLPAPEFRKGYQRTIAIVFGPRSFEDMNRDDRIRACFQHCALNWVTSGQMTNQSLRERFGVPEAKSASVSQVIAATIETGLVKSDEAVGGSRKFARYVPHWA